MQVCVFFDSICQVLAIRLSIRHYRRTALARNFYGKR
jgi:hypothetical protein